MSIPRLYDYLSCLLYYTIYSYPNCYCSLSGMFHLTYKFYLNSFFVLFVYRLDIDRDILTRDGFLLNYLVLHNHGYIRFQPPPPLRVANNEKNVLH